MDSTYIFASLTLGYALLTLCYFSVPVLVTVMILSKRFQMDRIVSVASAVYGFDLYFCATEVMIRFTDVVIILSLYIC